MTTAKDATLADLLSAYCRVRSGDRLQEAILRMREIDGLALDEIAVELDLPIECIARELARAISTATGCRLLYVDRRAE